MEDGQKQRLDDSLKIEENRKALASCKLHYFGDEPYENHSLARCESCGGVMAKSMALAYRDGFVAAGGLPDKIWPGSLTRCPG